MSDIAIRVDNLGKRFRIGAAREQYYSLREAIMAGLKAPFRRFKRLSGYAGDENEIFWALRNVSFEVKQGEVVGVIGRNGAGKSTLLKLLSRITYPTEGRAEIHGRVGSLLEVGTGFHPELTGRENIYLNGAILGMRKTEIQAKFDEIVEFAEISQFLDTPVKRYSSGMYVRLAFAVAAHLEPEILLVDEVLAVGDAQFQKKCMSKMGDVAHQGRTVFLVSHNMPVIANTCERAILLNRGGVEMDGPTAEVIDQYLSSVRTQSGEVVFDNLEEAPGNELVRLRAVRILQGEDGYSKDEVLISQEIKVEIDFVNLIPDAKLYAAIWLKDKWGSVVFASSNHSSVSIQPDPWYERDRPVGLYRSTCVIPPHFLNDSTYSVTAIVGKHVSNTQILHEDAVTFHVVDTGEMRQEYGGQWIGGVRPRFHWETEYIDSKSEDEASLSAQRSISS